MVSSFFNKTKKSKGILALVLGIAILALGIPLVLNLSPSKTSKASGVTPVITPSTANVSTSGTISVAFVTSADLSGGDIIKLSYPDTYTGSMTVANTNVNGVAVGGTTSSTSNGIVTNEISLNAGILSGSTVTINTTGLTTPVAAGNYTFSIDTEVGDYGASLQYVGEANVVEVRAFVPVSLSLDIRDTGDTTNINVCDLGTASTASVSTCSYRLKVGTNAANGYTVSMQADGDLLSGSNAIANASVGNGGTGGTNITAGTELYGVIITPGNITGSGGSITLTNSFDGGSNPVLYNYTSSSPILVANKPNSPAVSGDTTNTSLVTHQLGIDNETPAGLYTQKITYTVAPSF